MSCPYCNAENFLSNIAEANVITYKTSALSATVCCKQPIRVYSQTSVVAAKTTTKELTDSWGIEFAKPSLVGKFILVKYDLNLTTGIIHEVIEDDPSRSFVCVNDNFYQFSRSSILLVGTKAEMELASKEHSKLVDTLKIAKQQHSEGLKLWLKKYSK